MSKISNNSPHPIDIHIGHRLRQLRHLRGMSQHEMGQILGISFQQIQKYERAINRLSVSRLYDISQLLSIEPGYFFEEIVVDATASREPVGLTRDMLLLIRHYTALNNQPFRKAFLELIKTANRISHQ